MNVGHLTLIIILMSVSVILRIRRVMNGPLKFLTARKILPLLDLLSKFKRVLACSCYQNFCSCLRARFLVSIARDFVDPSLD